MSPTHPINMKSIGLKIMKIEQIKKVRFLIPVTVAFNFNNNSLSLIVTNKLHFFPKIYYSSQENTDAKV